MNDVYLMGLRVLAYALLSIWGLWIMCVCVMRLQMLRNAGQLTTGIKIFGYPTLFIGLLLDTVVNVAVCTVLFMEPPKEWTVSARLLRHSEGGNGWRRRLAFILRTQLLDITDDTALNSAATYEEVQTAGVAAYKRIAATSSPELSIVFREITGA